MRIIHVLRKPLSEGTVASNVLKHGCGGLNIDATRIAHTEPIKEMKAQTGGERLYAQSGRYETTTELKPSGRWPANVILQHLDGCRCAGIKRVGGTGTAYEPAPKAREHMIYGDGRTLGRTVGYADEDGKETVANWICESGCPVARLDADSLAGGMHSAGKARSSGQAKQDQSGGLFGVGQHEGNGVRFGDTGGASRFYKQVGGEK